MSGKVERLRRVQDQKTELAIAVGVKHFQRHAFFFYVTSVKKERISCFSIFIAKCLISLIRL
jgi:hypothetical protein